MPSPSKESAAGSGTCAAPLLDPPFAPEFGAPPQPPGSGLSTPPGMPLPLVGVPSVLQPVLPPELMVPPGVVPLPEVGVPDAVVVPPGLDPPTGVVLPPGVEPTVITSLHVVDPPLDVAPLPDVAAPPELALQTGTVGVVDVSVVGVFVTTGLTEIAGDVCVFAGVVVLVGTVFVGVMPTGVVLAGVVMPPSLPLPALPETAADLAKAVGCA